MVFVGINFPEAGGSARGLPQTDDGVEGQAAAVRYLEKLVSGEGAPRSGHPGTGGIHLQVAGTSGGVGGI